MTDLGYDLTLQIQAANHLLAGKGLSFYAENINGQDLGRPLIATKLTWFPCGYSLYAAALIALGGGLSLILKLFGALCSVAGWWGWGRLALCYIGQRLERNAFERGFGFALAVVLPVLFTPPWNGTDIFLWASVPWVVDWLAKGSRYSGWDGLRLYGLAGVLCGLTVLMRYASLFLVVGCVLLILGQGWKSRLLTVQRLVAYLVGLTPFLCLQWFVNHSLQSPVHPGGLVLGQGLGFAVRRFLRGFGELASVNNALFFWMPDQLRQPLTDTIGLVPWQLAVAIVTLALPVIVAWKAGTRGLPGTCSDRRVAATTLVPTLALVLWGCMLFGRFDYLGDRRYYVPVEPLAVFVAWFLAVPRGASRGATGKVIAGISSAYVLAFALTGIARMALILLPEAQSLAARSMVVGSRWSRPFPSLALYYEQIPARRFVAEYLGQHPDTLLFTSFEPWFWADRHLDQSRIFRLLFYERMRVMHVSGPARLLFMVRDCEGTPGQFIRGWQDGKPLTASLDHFPNMRLLKRFDDWRIKVIEIQVPVGVRVPMDGVAASGREDQGGSGARGGQQHSLRKDARLRGCPCRVSAPGTDVDA
jgi:hypothetical protein